MASQPPAAHTPDVSAGMSPADFEQALREATASLQTHGFGPRTAVIPELRRALRARTPRERFDQGLRRLRDEECVRLEPHAHPELLSSFEAQDALAEGEALLYLLLWLR